MKLFFVVFVFFSVLFWNFFDLNKGKGFRTKEEIEGEEQEALADKALGRAAFLIIKEGRLIPFGTMGQMLNKTEKLGLSFKHQGAIDISEARKLLIGAGNILLKEINGMEKMRQYLVRYPFLPRNIDIGIFIEKKDASKLPFGNLCVVHARNGILEYDIRHPRRGFLVTIYKETYEEAEQRIENPSLPMVPFLPDNRDFSPEDIEALIKGTFFCGSDGVYWKLDEKSRWVKSR